ncbi:MAG: ACP S-malonyltransferase [Syntrophales bacterium]|nr:ACP S-malonyltransferase [Syntrophales bacterium]
MESEKVAVVFPGQGSQRPGMGKDFFDALHVARATYEEASDMLGFNVAEMCFGEDERLNLTEYTQPCILTTEIAMFRSIQTMYDFNPSIFAGHSLGEFTALVAAGVIPFAEAVQIVNIRGKLMQSAAPVGFGAMTAVIADPVSEEELENLLVDLPIDLANINSIRQIVISGKADSMPEAEDRIKEAFSERGVRLVRLNVSAPFHSRFMRVIADDFASVLEEKVKGEASSTYLVASNYTGDFHSGNVLELKKALTLQLGHPVRWRDNMLAISKMTRRIFEIGPGRPLRDFFKTEGIDCQSIVSIATAEKAMQPLN